MHAVIYGTGKWSQLLKIKLKSFGFDSILIGNNPLIADYSRTDAPDIAEAFQGLPVFIASATKDHFADISNSSMFHPSIIFVEKGFINSAEKKCAVDWAYSRNVPIYILSQYRYSKILDIIDGFKDDVISICHNWTIDKGPVSEWVHHIISIDNYIKNSNTQLYASNTGSYLIDKVSNFRIDFGKSRELKTIIKTKNETIVLNFGTTNTIHIKNNYGVDAYSCFENEDCITLQLKDILRNTENLRLERL